MKELIKKLKCWWRHDFKMKGHCYNVTDCRRGFMFKRECSRCGYGQEIMATLGVYTMESEWGLK